MKIYLYKITNLVNGKIYIGKTKRKIDQRFATHCRNARRKSNMAICKAISKYGSENFVTENLGYCLSNKSAGIVERELIRYWKKKCKIYNSTSGGDGSIGYRFTKEQRRKLSKSMCGRPMTWSKKIHATIRKSHDEWRSKISEGMQRMSEEEKAARMRKIWRTRRS